MRYRRVTYNMRGEGRVISVAVYVAFKGNASEVQRSVVDKQCM